MEHADVIVIGAGPAGLTAAWKLAQANRKVLVIEQNNIVGGIARTESYRGYLFDIGGHRFFSKLPEIQALWQESFDPEGKANARSIKSCPIPRLPLPTS